MHLMQINNGREDRTRVGLFTAAAIRIAHICINIFFKLMTKIKFGNDEQLTNKTILTQLHALVKFATEEGIERTNRSVKVCGRKFIGIDDLFEL